MDTELLIIKASISASLIIGYLVINKILSRNKTEQLILKIPIINRNPKRIDSLLKILRLNLKIGLRIIAPSVFLSIQLAIIEAHLLAIKILIELLIIIEGGLAEAIIDSPNDEELKQRLGTIVPAVLVGVRWVTVLGGIIAAMYALSIDPTPLLGGAGIVVLILGVGAQNTLNDLYSGMFILFEDYYRIGDLVEINGFTGAVSKISLRSTFLKSQSGEIKILANGKITTANKKFGVLNDIFITYSRRDIQFVERLHYSLKKSGHDAWIDFEDIGVARDWEREIIDAIEKASICLIVLSPDWIASEVCQRELTLIRANKKRIIPIVVREVNPSAVHNAVSSLNWIFFREEDSFEGSYRRLLKVINNLD